MKNLSLVDLQSALSRNCRVQLCRAGSPLPTTVIDVRVENGTTEYLLYPQEVWVPLEAGSRIQIL